MIWIYSIFRTDLNFIMEQEYTIAIGWKIFYGVIAFGLAVFSLLLLIKMNSSTTQGVGAGITMSLIMLTVSILLGLYIIKRQVILSDTAITVRGMFGTKELLNTQVKGFRTTEKAIIIEANERDLPKIKINDYMSIGKNDELLSKLSNRYTNIDKVNYQNNLNEIYTNNELGTSEEKRIEKFSRSKRIALIYNFGGVSFFVLSLIFTEFTMKNNLVQIILALYPLIGIVLLALNKGVIKLVSGKNSAFPGIVFGIYPATITALLIMITHYDFVSYSNLELPVVLISLVIGIILWKYGYDKSENAAKWQIVLLVLVSVFYAIPLTMLVNCKLDTSVPEIYTTTISSRHILHNNGRDYCHIEIAPWDNIIQESKDLHIDHELYDQLQSKQSAHVNQKKGFLKISWFYVTP